MVRIGKYFRKHTKLHFGNIFLFAGPEPVTPGNRLRDTEKYIINHTYKKISTEMLTT